MLLYYIILYSLNITIRLLLNKGTAINAQGGYYSNILQVAIVGGYKQVVKILLNKDANVNAQGRKYGNALQAALEGGYKQVVKMLLNIGAYLLEEDDTVVGLE